jgi:hypothetical protein
VFSLIDLLLGFRLPAFAMAEDRKGENEVETVKFIGPKASLYPKQEVRINYIIVMRRKEFLNSRL